MDENLQNQNTSEDVNTLKSVDDFFHYIRDFLSKDKNLCNFSRYIDYGKIYNETWNSIKSCVNCNNLANNVQLIRFVKKIDTKFLIDLNDKNVGNYNEYDRMIYHDFGKKSIVLYDINSIRDFIASMINLDCTYKIKGSSLTAIDFICHNPNPTNEEKRIFSSIYNNIIKTVFVGDKCYLLAVVDKYHNVYVSFKILNWIFDHDESPDKTVFKNIFTKFINLISKISFYFMNCTMLQFINNEMLNPMVSKILDSNVFDTQEKIQLNSIEQLNLNMDMENLDFKQYNIYQQLNKIIKNYLNDRYFVSNLDITTIINKTREAMENSSRYLVTQAYMNGLKFNGVFTKCGWSLVTDWEEERKRFRYSTGFYGDVSRKKDHIFIKKDVDFIPVVAYMYADRVRCCKDKENPYRIIKKEYQEEWGQYYKIHTLYLDVTAGIMYCDGKHPNVNYGNVCMGDLKGKVVFSTCTPEEMANLLGLCEQLLKGINYTSSYEHNKEYYFESDEKSESYNAAKQIVDDSDVKQEDSEELCFVDEQNDIDDNDNQTDVEPENVVDEQENDTDSIVYESEDEFEDATNE